MPPAPVAAGEGAGSHGGGAGRAAAAAAARRAGGDNQRQGAGAAAARAPADLPPGRTDSPAPTAPALLSRPQDEGFETPMQPITMMRNALGREEGGSGVPLQRVAYAASVEYWQQHAAVVAGEMPSGD